MTQYTPESYQELVQEELAFDYAQNKHDAQEEREKVE